MRVCGWRGDRGEGHSPSKASTPARRLPPWGRGQVCLKFKGSSRKADPSGPLGSFQPVARLPTQASPSALPWALGGHTPIHTPAAPVRKLKIQVASSGVFSRGSHLWSAWCSQDAGTLPGTEAAARPRRQKLLLESTWKISRARPPGQGHGLPPAGPAHKEAVVFLRRPAAWHRQLAAAN